MGGEDHRCEWRDKAERLAAELARVVRSMEAAEALIRAQTEAIRTRDETLAKQGEQLSQIQATVEKLQRHVFGKRSEKMPSVDAAIRDPDRAETERIAALQTRRENAEKKRQLVTRRIEHKVAEEQKVCPNCGGHDFTKLGDGNAR
jgi:transposase